LRTGCRGEYLGLRELGNREVKKLHNEELNDLYSSPNNIQVIKLRRIRWVGHVTHMAGEERCI
jgi:hypothetical protein